MTHAKISASLLGADIGHLADSVAAAEAAGIDAKDGRFVPDISFGGGTAIASAVAGTVSTLIPLLGGANAPLATARRHASPLAPKSGGRSDYPQPRSEKPAG